MVVWRSTFPPGPVCMAIAAVDDDVVGWRRGVRWA